MLQQGPKLKVLAKNDIGEDIIATPAIADGRIFIRGRENAVLLWGGQVMISTSTGPHRACLGGAMILH